MIKGNPKEYKTFEESQKFLVGQLNDMIRQGHGNDKASVAALNTNEDSTNTNNKKRKRGHQKESKSSKKNKLTRHRLPEEWAKLSKEEKQKIAEARRQAKATAAALKAAPVPAPAAAPAPAATPAPPVDPAVASVTSAIRAGVTKGQIMVDNKAITFTIAAVQSEDTPKSTEDTSKVTPKASNEVTDLFLKDPPPGTSEEFEEARMKSAGAMFGRRGRQLPKISSVWTYKTDPETNCSSAPINASPKMVARVEKHGDPVFRWYVFGLASTTWMRGFQQSLHMQRCFTLMKSPRLPHRRAVAKACLDLFFHVGENPSMILQEAQIYFSLRYAEAYVQFAPDGEDTSDISSAIAD